MTDNAAKRKIVYAVTAAIIAVALILSCVLTAFLYTRTGGAGTGNTADGGENADENKLLNSQYSYGERLPGDVAPSGSFVMNIASATDLTNFLNSTTYTYGILTQDISLSSSNMSNTSGEVKPSTDRTLAEGKTLDGNGHTITTYFYESATLECREVSGGLTSDWYKSYFTFQQNGTNTAVDIGNGVSAFGLSNVVSVNRGTIKNLKVSVSASSGRESVAKAVVTAPEGYDGNIGMGVVAGINFGTVENCASTVNIPYGFYGSPVQANSRNAGDSGNKILSRQGIVAVGGIVGINKGNVLNTEVNQNSDIGTYRSVYTVSYYYWVNRVTGDIYNDNIGSGIVGGVAGLNDGGVINGVSYNAAAGSLSNKNNHTAISYTGMIVGLANLQNAKGGAAVSYNAGYYANGAIQSGGTISVAAGSVQNIKYSLYSGFGAACEAYAFTGSRGGFMENGDGWTAVGTYVGLVGGRVTTNGTVATKIVTGGVTFDSAKYSFRAWNATELNGSLAFTDNSMPLFGYGSGGTVTSDHYQNLYVAARLEGQNTEASLSGDFGNDSVFLSLAKVGYLWNSYVGSDGTVVSRVLYTVNFDNMPDLAGRNYSVYKQNGSVQGVDGSVTVGSDDYNASSLTDGGRIEWNADHAPQWTLMLYSLRIDDFSDINAFNAFVSTDKGTNNEHFAYAYANAVKLTQTNTLSSPSLTGDKVLKSWKTLDGNGQTVVLNDIVNHVSGSSVQVTVGGQTIVGISDFISVNYGTVKDLNLYYGTSSRTADGTVTSPNSFAYGRVAGVNFGTLQNVNVNNDGTVGDGSPTNVTTTQPFGVVGLAVGVNAGTIDTMHTIVWQNLSANASSFAAAGGAVGMNDGGTLKNVIVDGVASASVRATASGGESFVGGVLGAGSNYGSWTSGTVTVSAPSGAASSPFEDWTFVGKQILRTEGSNVGMLAGRIAADPTLAGNGGQAIREMVVMMPQTNSAIGWFTSETGRMSLLGKTTGVAAQSGYIATDLVVGYYAYIDDASTSYISKIYTDYNIAKGDSGVTALFTTGVYNGSSAVRSVSSISVQTENMSASAAALISFGANLSSATQSVFVPVQVAATDSVFVSEGNDGNYAPSVKLYYDYDVNLSQSASDADSSMSKTSLEAFITGDASSATGAGTHKIIAAGASGATLTSDMSLSITIVADFVKKRGIDGGGFTVTYNPGAVGGLTYERGDENLTAIGVLASVNRSTIINVRVAFGGSLSANVGNAYAFGGIVGVNLGTVSGEVTVGGNAVSMSGNNAFGYFGGAIGINGGIADGVKVAFDGGTLYADSGSGTLAVLGGAIGLQDSPSLSDVQVSGYDGKLTVSGAGLVGGVIGVANLSDSATVSGVTATKTELYNISNAVYGMTLESTDGYKGLISGSLSDGAVTGVLSGAAAHYPDGVENYLVPWTTNAKNVLSMYGSGTATALDGILFKVSDHSDDGGAEYLTDRTISVNGASRSFTFDVSQIASLSSSVSFDAKYCYYDTDGALATDDSYTGAPSQSGTVYTTTVSGTYENSASYVPTLDVLIDYTVNIGNGENQQLVDFMRGEGSTGNGSYAGARQANLVSGAAFSLDASTASLRGETSAKGKVLVGSGNNVNITGALPTATYDGNTVVGGFFAVNRADISGVIVTSSESLSPNGHAFGLLAGVNEGTLTDVGATLTKSVSAGVGTVGVLTGINKGVIDGATVSANGLSASYGEKISFGSFAGVNEAEISSSTATLAGAYTLASDKIYSGAAVGENGGALLSDIEVVFSDAALTADPTSSAYVGGVVGKQDGGSLTDVGTSGGDLSMSVTSGIGYVGGIVGIINTGAGVQTVAEHELAPSRMSGAYAGAYESDIYGNAYKGLIAGAVGSIASGAIEGATAHYYENGYTAGDFAIPWFAAEEGVVSMYGFNAADADTTYAVGMLFKMSDHSDDGAADFVKGRILSGTAASAEIYFPISDFSGANDLSIAVDYVTWSGGVKSVTTLATLTPTSDVTYVESRVNNGGDYVPTIDFFASYSVDITAGTEGDWQNAEGIANSLLFCFIDGVGENQLYAGAQVGNVTEDILVDKPMNGYVTMCEGKTLQGNGHTLNMSWVGDTTNGNFVLQQHDREKDDAEAITSSGGGYVQVDAGGGTTGAIGGLIAVNYGNVNGFNVVHENNSATTAGYAFIAAADAAAGVLVGVNFGTVENVTYDDSTSGSMVKLFGQGGSDVIFGGIVGVNAGDVSNLKLNGRSAVTVDGDGDAVYGGVLGANYGAAENIVLSDSGRNSIEQVGTGVYGGAVGSNDGTLENVTVTVGTAIAGSDYLSRLSSAPEQRTISLGANDLAIWGGVLGYNAGSVTGATLLANVNYGMSAGSGHVSAGGVVGMNDGGALAGVKATGWGGFYVLSSNIMASSSKSVFVGGLVGSMNADGASEIGFIEFANAVPATLTDSVFALSGGMVTMNSYSVGMTRYGYVTGVLAAVYGNIPEGAVTNTFWFIPDKLKSVEGDDAEVLPAFHGGNATYPTYISVFGTAPTDWLSDGMTANAAEFAVNSYGFALVDSDDNPINYLTMDAMITSGVLTLTVHKPSGNMFITTPDFDHTVTGSGGTGAGSVGAGGGQDQTLTVSNVGNKGVGYVTFSFESGVYALTDSAYAEFTQYMILSFLSTKPFGTVKGSGSNDYYTYSTVDGEISRSIGDSVYRVYQVWSGATEMRIQGSNHTVTISAVPSQPLVLGKGKIFNGGQDSGNKISVVSSFENNIAEYSFGDDQNYLVVSEFLAINYGTLTNANVSITGTDGGHDIYRSANDVLANAANAGIDLSGTALKGFIYGMLVGVNEGEVSQLGGYSFDRTIELDSDAGSRYNSIFGGMVGAQSGADALIKDIGNITFGTQERAGGITMSGAADLVAAGGVVGIAIEGTISNFTVNLTAESFLSVTANHNTAAGGGVVGDLRANLTDVTFESEYRSEMKISNTNASGVATLANLVGVVNSFNGTTASIERVKVIGVGYLYNGIDENGTVTTSSINLYTAGVVGMGANYGNVDAESVAAMPEGERKIRAQQVVAAYGEIIPAKLDSVYVDFEGYVRAKANTNVGMIAARLLNGVTEEARNVDISLISNLVWQTKLEGDSLWTTNVNYADYSSAMNTNSAVAVLGYAPATIDSNTPDLRGVGMRIWLTNNLYAVNSSVADMVITWTSGGNLNASVIGDIGWQNLAVSSVYYDKSGAELSERFKTIKSYGTYGSATQTTVAVDVAEALSEIKNSSAVFPDGIYMLRLTFNEVYIYNAKQLMTFMSSGADTTQGLLSSDADYNSYANANVGIIANDLEVNYATQGTGNKAGHYYTTAVTMRADKILEGNGNNVTITTSGNIHSAVIDDKGNTPAGALLSGEYYWDYIGGMNTLSSADLNQMDTQYSIGIRAGGLFLGRNLGTIQNIDFSLPNSVTIDNIDYAKWHDVINQDSWREYGTSLYVGIVTAVNAGTIDNCTLTLGNNVKVNGFRKSASGPQLQKGYINELTYKVNTMSVNGGFAGLMYGTSSAPSYISNCTVNLSDGSEIRATSQASSFSWSGRSDSVYAYAGGVVGWLTSDSTVYNVTINGTGTMTAWGDLNVGSFSSGNKVTSAGSIVGLNSDHPTYTISNNPDEFGMVDGVICNWNGAAYFLSTGNNNIFYSGTSRVNYYIGAQLAGVAEQNTLNNIYFMYGIDQYKTFHQDNWYYGDNVAARQASEDFLDKYNYIVSRSIQLLESDSFGYSAIYAIAQKPGGSASLTEVAYRNADGSVTVNLEDKVIDGTTVPAFTFENYANYQTAVDDSTVSGATNFSLYVASGTTFYVANQYFPRITSTMDSGGNKDLDFVGARAAAMMTVNGTADWNNLFKPNNVYIYEVGFGSNDGTELDMNDPETTAYLTFQTKSITSDVAVNITLASDSLGAQFVWEIRENWVYPDDPLPVVSYTSYYNNVTSLEQAKANNNFTRIFDRDNNGADYTFTYVMGLAVKIAMDDSRYYYNEEEGVFYDSVAKIYDGTTIDDPMLYYADEDGNPINMPELGLGTVSASVMSPSYYRDNADGTLNSAKLPKSSTDKAGAYRIRISFSSEGGENSKVNTTNRTIMFSDFDHIDIYTVVLPKGVMQNGVSVSKTYDGTVNYNDSTTVFTGMVSGDNVALDTGAYTVYEAGSGNIFKANFTDFLFSYGVMTNGTLEIKTATISLFEGSGDTINYAPVSSVKTGTLTLIDGATDFYVQPTANYKGTINRKHISLSDVDLDMYGGEFVEGGVNPPLEYDAMTTYDTAAFQSGSTILSKGLTLSSDKTQLVMEGYRSGENIRFTITFLANGGGTYESSVKNYGTYEVYLNILDSGNFALYENNAETDIMYLGQLSITPYAILAADVTYVIEAGFLSKIFDNNGTIPFTFNPDNLRIIAKNGYEVQPDEYTLTVGDMYTTEKGSSTKVAAKDAGEYDIYFAISNFNCPLGNYTLANMTVTFVDSEGNKISYFVLPKEISLTAATKEFDGTDAADPSVTTFTYEDGKGPVDGTGDVFGLEYTKTDAGANIDIKFTDTSYLTLNGTRYTVINVAEGDNKGKDNYCVSSVTVAKGNITPVKVILESATMTYNNRNYIDYRAEGTVVIIKNEAGDTVNIYPAATFNNKNAGTGKTVTFATTTETIAGTRYNVLTNSTYVTPAPPETGAGFAGNYYVENAVWNSVGEIIKNTISKDDISGNISVVQIQSKGSQVTSGSEYAFENLSGKSYTYRYGYIVGFEIKATATIIEDDLLSDHLTVVVTNTTNSVNGYAGSYTLELMIVGNDYEWDEDVKTSDVKVINFRVRQQTLTQSNVNASLTNYELTYRNASTTLSPSVSVTDKDGRSITSTDGLSYTLTAFTNSNEHFSMNTYRNGSVLDVGDYYFTVVPKFSGADAINYAYSGSGKQLQFCVNPFRLNSITATKEFDNTTSFETAGNEAVFGGISGGEPFTPSGHYLSKNAGSRSLVLEYVDTTINGISYRLLKDADGSVTNNTWTSATGTIHKYTISARELNSYLSGWVKDMTERQTLSIKSGSAAFEYRSDEASGYTFEHFLFDASGMSYGFNASRNASSISVTQSGAPIETLNFIITVKSDVASYTFGQGNDVPTVLPAGSYNVSVSIVSSTNFTLDAGAGSGSFTINKQEISGGGASGSANVFIALDGDFSYTYGDGNYNLPTVEDSKFVYTMSIIDKYTGKIAATYTAADAVIGLIEFTTTADSTAFFTSLEGPLYVGGYFVWASEFADELLANYAIPEGTKIAVYIAGTAVPEAPDPEEGEDGGESGEEGSDTGDTVVTIPSLAAAPAYFILPRTLNIESIAKTYDGTDSFSGATLTSDAVATDGLTADMLSGVYASPNANYDSTGTVYIEGNKGSDFLKIDVVTVTVNGTTYHTLSADGATGNYCLEGEFENGIITVAGAKIMRKAVSAQSVSLTSDTYETVYGSGEEIVLPDVTADFGGATETVAYTAESVVYKQGGEVVTPENVGGYEMYITDVAFDNYEVAGGLSEVLVNAGRSSESGEGGETGGETGGEGGETGGETGEEGGEGEQPEVYTYYIVPREVVISGVVKFYDKKTELTYYGEDEEGISADVTVTDEEGNEIVDAEGNPIVLRVQGRFVAAGAGKNKDVLVDFTPFGYYVNFEATNVAMYYRLIVIGEDGTAGIAGNYCIAASETAVLPAQFDEDYVPEDPENDDTPVVNNGLVYNMTLVGAGTEIPAPLTVEGVTKVYDGTFDITAGTVSGLLEGDEGLTVAKWRYDDKDAATGKSIGLEADETAYVYDGNTYYAVYMTSGGVKVLSDYGVAATDLAEVEETVVGENGEETTVTVKYAVVAGVGTIDPYTLTKDNFSGANVAGIQSNSVEFNSLRTYTSSEIRATLSALGFTAAAVNSGGSLTVTFPNGDVITFTTTLGGGNSAHDAGTYVVSLALTADTVNYKMNAPYTFDFIITKQSITAVYVTTGNIAKTYDGTGDMPEYSADGWQVYAVDKQGAAIEMSAFGSIDMSAATIVFTRYNEEEGVYEYFTPVNVTEEPGYRIYVKGFSLDSSNYIFTSTEDALGCVSFDATENTSEAAYYRIEPRTVNVSADAFASKTFDGAYSLWIDGGVQGETVIVGDNSGVNASLAGTYGTLDVKPFVSGVATSEDALNPESVAANYALYYEGAPVTDQTVITVTDYTVTKADILVAERENGGYAVGISGLQGLDFLFAKSTDITIEAQQRIISRLMTGEVWTENSFDSSSDFAMLNKAAAEAFSLYVNNGENAVVQSAEERYFVNDFAYVEQGGSYVLTFTFAGMNGYDESTATDRYTFVINGALDDVKSTNHSTTSSELESGQLTDATAGAGVAVSTPDELKEAIKNNKTFYLANSIYGADLSEVSDTVFTGTFDGRGYTVSLTGSGAKTSDSGAAGLLVAVNGGVIKNVSFKLMPTGALGAGTVGGLVGINNGTIENVSVVLVSDLTADGATKVGGAVGENAQSGVIANVSFVYAANVSVNGATYGAIAGTNGGAMTKIAVRVDESAGAGNYTVSAAGAGYVAGSSDGTADGVIIAIPSGRLAGANALWASGTTTATNVYSYVSVEGTAGGQLSLLEPYTNGYIGYYFATADDYTTDGMKHNELTSADEYNKSYYVDYTGGTEGYIAIEAIAPYNRFVWDGYGISYRTTFGDGNVGSALNRIVALFAAGDIAAQFAGTTVVTSGVNAFTVAIGVRGGTVEVEGDVETSIKEVVYTGYAQVYTVNITVTTGGVSETKELSVGGTEAGYYSKASLEGIIGGGAGGETIGDVTYDSGSRTEYTFSGDGTTVANGIALVIYPKQIEADDATATKYYDTTTAGTLTVKDGDNVAGEVQGNYYDAKGVATSQVAAAEAFGFASFPALTRNVLAKDGVLYGVTEKTDEEGGKYYDISPITVGNGEDATELRVDDTVGKYSARDLMIAMSRLADEDYVTGLGLPASQLEGFGFVKVCNLTANVVAGEDNAATVSGNITLRPVLGGEKGDNYSLYSAAWLASSDMTIGADESVFALTEKDMTVAGAILPVDLGVTADYTVGRDQSYNSAMLDPAAKAGTAVTVTEEQAAALGITAENYAKLVAEVAAGIVVSFDDTFFGELVGEGVLEKRADGKYYAVNAEFATATLPDKADGGNFVVTFTDNTVTFRYFATTVKDGAAFYTLTSADDYYKWIDNEGGGADYYAIDMLLTTDIDFGGATTDMLSWRDGEGNVVGYKGTFDGDGKALKNMLIIRSGSAALFERVDEGAVVRDLTVADSVVVATGDGSAAGGIAVDNYGVIVNCAFEGVLSADAKTGGIAATNYGKVEGGASVNRAYVSEGGAAEGIAENADDGSGTVGTATGVSITESAVIYADGTAVEETVTETAEGGAASWDDEALVPVISAYVFDETYVKVDGDGKFVTDNFFKLNAVDKLFGWVGADMVTAATQTGFYGSLTLG